MHSHKSLPLVFLAPLALISMAAGPCEDENIGGLSRDGAAADTTDNPKPDAGNTGSGGSMGSGGIGDPIGTGGRAGSGGNTGSGGTGGVVGCGGATKPAVADPCTPASPTATGSCRCVIGFYWNGSTCVSLGGCSCTSGCDRLYGDITACQSDHRSCAGGMGGSGGAPTRDGGSGGAVGTGGSGGALRDGSTAEAGPDLGACPPNTHQGDPCSPNGATCGLPTGGGCFCATTWFCRL